jgi:hypothetical protein
MSIREKAIFLLVLLISSPVVAQTDDRLFAAYSDSVAGYLERIHKTKKVNIATYPGGFPAWQRDSRTKLASLLGLEQIEADVGKQIAVVELQRSTQEDGYQRQLGSIQTEPGVTIPFWLLTPNGDANVRRPLAVCAHGHDRDGWNTYAGVYRDEAHRMKAIDKDGDVGVQAVKRGFVTVVPATRGLAEAASIPDLKGRHGNRPCRAQLIHCLLAGRTAVGERVWDTQRILDWALRDLNVDDSRVLMTGNSGGGVLTVYVAALDQRVTVAVPSCSFTSYTSRNGYVFHCDCCLVPRAPTEVGDMADIGALTAPRRLLAVHGRKDGLHSFADVERAMTRVHEIYAKAGAKGRFEHEWGDDGHKFYPDLMWPFIEASF